MVQKNLNVWFHILLDNKLFIDHILLGSAETLETYSKIFQRACGKPLGEIQFEKNSEKTEGAGGGGEVSTEPDYGFSTMVLYMPTSTKFSGHVEAHPLS